MGELFISTIRPPSDIAASDYEINVELYQTAMRQRWVYANIISLTDTPYALSWELNEANSRGILGGLQTDRKTVSFGITHLDSAVDYILWHRQFVPKVVQLYLFDENLDLNFELTTDASKDLLKQLIRSIL